jgi:hypothetical protein
MQLFGRPNADFGKPLPENLHVLDLMLYGYFRHNGNKDFKWGTIQTSDNKFARAWDKDIIQKARYFLPCQVNCIIGSEDEDSITLRSTGNKDNPSVFKALDEKLDIQTIIEKTTKFMNLANVENYFEQIKTPNGKVPFDSKVVVKGVVTWMNTDRPDALGRVLFQIMNPDNEEETIRVRVDPTTLSLEFGELSEIIVFGKPARSMYRDRETGELTDGDVVIEAFGIYVISKTPKTSSTEPSNEDEVVDGWLS